MDATGTTSSPELVVSPLSARGQERLARLRASIQQRFGGDTRHPTPTSAATAATQPPRTMIRQRIERAAQMTVDEIFFREFGTPKQLAAVDFELARPPPAPRQAPAGVPPPSAFAQPAPVRNSAFSSRMQAAAAEVTHVPSRPHSTFDRTHMSNGGPFPDPRAAGAYVSQLQRPSQITTPKKASLKRLRSADEPASAEKPGALPPAQKPRLLSDVTSTFNNRSFRNVGHLRGASSGLGFASSPVRKAPDVPRAVSRLPQPSPSKFGAPQLFGQRHQPSR
ncbi:hypothetical protein PybrP1_007919 [[Pythium] brassicae (nom. inval.)]|nr:hypothetical protein PybrP1_007919 [[Pythium] brassicae (nom. inval.)]